MWLQGILQSKHTFIGFERCSCKSSKVSFVTLQRSTTVTKSFYNCLCLQETFSKGRWSTIAFRWSLQTDLHAVGSASSHCSRSRCGCKWGSGRPIFIKRWVRTHASAVQQFRKHFGTYTRCKAEEDWERRDESGEYYITSYASRPWRQKIDWR